MYPPRMPRVTQVRWGAPACKHQQTKPYYSAPNHLLFVGGLSSPHTDAGYSNAVKRTNRIILMGRLPSISTSHRHTLGNFLHDIRCRRTQIQPWCCQSRRHARLVTCLKPTTTTPISQHPVKLVIPTEWQPCPLLLPPPTSPTAPLLSSPLSTPPLPSSPPSSASQSRHSQLVCFLKLRNGRKRVLRHAIRS